MLTVQRGISKPSGLLRRRGREAEGGGLLNRYTVKSRIEGSNPSVSASHMYGALRRPIPKPEPRFTRRGDAIANRVTMMDMPPPPVPPTDQDVERVFIESERNRFAGRALSLLVVLNGSAALVLLTLLAQAPPGTVDSQLAAAMMCFGGGAIAALLSSFLAYINRTVRMESPQRARARRVLRLLAIIVVLGSGSAFLIGMNMVGNTSAEKSSSHPKGPRQKKPVASPTERVQLLHGAETTVGRKIANDA
jgi:hypothetical protein